MRHYLWGTQDMDTRRIRKNGWNEVINAYMGKLPVNWPYNSVVTNPVIRTTILEKTSRLLNAKLRGKLVPRNDGDNTKAKIGNAMLDFQWDFANEGGPMIQKVASADQYARLFGAAFVLSYWDNKNETNEIKLLDPRDMFFDGAATHIRNARYVDVREFTTFDKLEQRGFDVKAARDMAAKGEITAEFRSTRYESIVKANLGLVDRTGYPDDLKNPVVEVVTEWGYDRFQKPYCTIFLPKYAMILYDGPNPYKHGKIPIAMLRYYPLVDDIFGESEVESVLPLQRAINAMICGFLDECNIKIRPPLKIVPSQVRIETIEYGPGAKWIVQDPNAIQEHTGGEGFIASFNSVYPMLINAFETAMGSQSQFNTQEPTKTQLPTATQVNADEKQQNVRDQYNQLHLAEFLEDIMMMWHSNNKQYIFDDPSKKYKVIQIVGRDVIQDLQKEGLDKEEVPGYAMDSIAQTIQQAPNAVSDPMISNIFNDVKVPTNPVILNPNESPENFKIKKKLDVHGEYADLYVTPSDFDGEYSYIADVESMAVGAGKQAQDAKQEAINFFTNPVVIQLLQSQGQTPKIKDVLVAVLEDAGYKDADSLFESAPQQPAPGQPPVGPGAPQPGVVPNGANGNPGMGALPQALPPQPGAGGLPQANGIPGQVPPQ